MARLVSELRAVEPLLKRVDSSFVDVHSLCRSDIVLVSEPRDERSE